MNDLIKEKYKNKVVIYDNIWLYFVRTAIDLIKDCENSKINITALEAFKLSGQGIQPSLEHSMDFDHKEANWNKAIDFLSVEDNAEYLYEVWYEGY